MTSPTLKEVLDEAFFKKLRQNAAFLQKGGTQKLLFFINALFPGSLSAAIGPWFTLRARS
ncbi:hypothetical protein [Komagataeibacter swingsii]|uniref:Uncharacterized protein n=1 Tax=Komagataeibacter swingsii TaxID=215220 RepID=A0A850NV87_9PROT|nr:hypothetical protein [Komagataeibacter swingsii]NVN35548.1 hypothetical protein [Komagataeibacter swingsii]